jgi:hypothetical protein
MARARLTPEKREERKRRAFTPNFRHYDPNDGIGRGNPRQWRAAAGAAIGGEGFTLVDSTPKRRRNTDLATLGLTEMPANAERLHHAYRLATRTAHPDGGGSDAAFTALRAAYDRLLEKM